VGTQHILTSLRRISAPVRHQRRTDPQPVAPAEPAGLTPRNRCLGLCCCELGLRPLVHSTGMVHILFRFIHSPLGRNATQPTEQGIEQLGQPVVHPGGGLDKELLCLGQFCFARSAESRVLVTMLTHSRARPIDEWREPVVAVGVASIPKVLSC